MNIMTAAYDGEKVTFPRGNEPHPCPQDDCSDMRSQSLAMEGEEKSLHDSVLEQDSVTLRSATELEGKQNAAEEFRDTTCRDDDDDDVEEWVSSSCDETTIRSQVNKGATNEKNIESHAKPSADSAPADHPTTMISITREDTAVEGENSTIPCDDHQSMTSTLVSNETPNQYRTVDDGSLTHRDTAIDAHLKELFDSVCDLQDTLQQQSLANREEEERRKEEKSNIASSALSRRTSRRYSLLQSHSMFLTPVKKGGKTRSASMPFVSGYQISSSAAIQMENAADNLRRVFSPHNNKNIHDRKASMKSLESGYESSSVSESNYGAVEEWHIGTQSCTTTVPGDQGTPTSIENLCLLTVDEFLGFICSLIDWRESLQTKRDLLYKIMKEAAVSNTMLNHQMIENLHVVDPSGQTDSMKETISSNDAILSYSSSLLGSLFGSLKDCFLLLHKNRHVSANEPSLLTDSTNLVIGAREISTTDRRCARRITQLEKLLHILSKVATMMGGCCSSQNHSNSILDGQYNNYRLTYFTLLELLHMSTVELLYTLTNEDKLAQPFSWRVSDKILHYWKNSSDWEFYCQLLSNVGTCNAVLLTRVDEAVTSSIDDGFLLNNSFAMEAVQQVSFCILKQALAIKLDLCYDGRHTHIPPLHEFIKVSLADLRSSCGWPDERLMAPPAVPLGAVKVASRLKDGTIIGREEILKKLSIALDIESKEEEEYVGDSEEKKEKYTKELSSNPPTIILYSAADNQGEEDLRKDTLRFDESNQKNLDKGEATYDGGVYGIGKSTIASSIVAQERTRRKFRGGVAWIELRLGSFIESNMKYLSYSNYLQSICLQLDDGLVPDVPDFCRFVSEPGDEESTKIVKEKCKLEKAKQQMKDYLKQRSSQSFLHGERILLILDNLSHPADLQWFQFTGKGCELIHILVTTQNRAFRMCSTDAIEVGFMSPSEASQLLLADVDLASDSCANYEAINSIISFCKYHPLILEAVGRWMNIVQAHSKPNSEFYMEIATSLSAMRHKSIPLLFQIIDATLSSLHNAPMSKLLKLCLVAKVYIIQPSGCFDDVYLDTPVSLLKNFWTSIFQNEDCADILDDITELHSGKDVFDLVIDDLELSGLFERKKNFDKKRSLRNDILSFKSEIFRLYGFYLGKGGGGVDPIAADTKEAWNNALINHYLGITFDCYEGYALCMMPRHMAEVKSINQIQVMLGDESFIHNRLSYFGCHQGTLMHLRDCKWLLTAKVTAERHNEREIDHKDDIIIHILEKVAVEYGKILSNGEDTFLILDVVQAMHEIGVSLFDMGFPGKAFRFFKTGRQVLKYNKMTDGINELVAISKYSLGKIHIKAERHKKAMAYLEHAQNIWYSLLGKESEYTAQISFHMGAIHAWFGHYKKAEACLERALLIRKKNDDKPGICRTLALIGYLHHKNGQLDEALQNYKDAMNIDLLSAPDCLDLSVYWNRIGNIHTLKGEYDEAMDCFTKSLENGGFTLDDENLDVADTLQNIAILCHFRMEYEDSLQCFDQALMIYRNKLGASHVKVGDLLYSMSSLYVDMNDYGKAQQALENSLRIRKQSFHEDHLDVAETLHLLGLVLVNLGDRKNAFPCFRESLRIRKTVLGSGNSLVADSIHTLGVFYKEINEYDKAIEYISRELKIRRKLGDSNAMQLAEILQFLGTLESLRHNHEESIKYYQESLQLKKDFVGDDHLMVAEILADLGRAYAEKGDYAEAILQVNNCLRIREMNAEQNQEIIGDSLQLLGKINAQFEYFDEALRFFELALEKRRQDNDASGETLYFIGCVYYDMDLEEKALQALEESVQLKRRGDSGDDGKETLDAYAKIGSIYAHLCRYDESLKNLQEFIEKSEIGNDSSFHEGAILLQKAEILHKMAVIYNLKGFYQDAIDCELKALQIYKSNLGERDIRIADSLHNAGCFFSVAGRCQESLEYFEDAYRLRKLILGRNHEDVATTLYNAASSQNMMGNHTKALKCLKESLEIRQNTLGEHHEKVTVTLQRIAAVCREMGDISEAIRTYEEILPALIDEVGSRDLRVASILYALGNLEDDQGNYESAMRYFEDALSIQKQAKSQEDVAACLSSMAFVHSNMKNEANALDCLSQALDIRKKELGEDHELVSDTHNNLAFFCSSLGKPEEAKFHLWEGLRIRKQCSAHQKVADTLNNLGNVHKDLHEYQLAIECYQEALRVREHAEIEGTADTYFNLGDLFVLKGDLDSATECYEESLKIRSTKLGNNHLKVADGHLNMVDIHLKRKEYNMALLRLEEVLRIKRHNLGNNNEDVANTLFTMGIVHNAMRDSKVASEYFEEAYNVFLAAGCPQDHPQVTKLEKLLRLRKPENKRLW